jgi:hypothetical protein
VTSPIALPDGQQREHASLEEWLPPRTTNERADRPRPNCCFVLAEQSSEEAGAAQLVVVHRDSEIGDRAR